MESARRSSRSPRRRSFSPDRMFRPDSSSWDMSPRMNRLGREDDVWGMSRGHGSLSPPRRENSAGGGPFGGGGGMFGPFSGGSNAFDGGHSRSQAMSPGGYSGLTFLERDRNSANRSPVMSHNLMGANQGRFNDFEVSRA